MGCGVPVARILHPGIGSACRFLASFDYYPSTSVHSRRLRAVLCICDDWSCGHEVSGGNFLTTVYTPFNRTFWPWVGVQLFGCAEPGSGHNSYTSFQVWGEVEAAI